jgi:hypothetical protein
MGGISAIVLVGFALSGAFGTIQTATDAALQRMRGTFGDTSRR